MSALKKIQKAPSEEQPFDEHMTPETPTTVGADKEAGLSEDEMYNLAVARQKREADELLERQKRKKDEDELRVELPVEVTSPIDSDLLMSSDLVDEAFSLLNKAKLNRSATRQSFVINDEDDMDLEGVSQDDINGILYRMQAVSAEIKELRESLMAFLSETPLSNKAYQEGVAKYQQSIERLITTLDGQANEVMETMPNSPVIHENLSKAKDFMVSASSKLDALAGLTAEKVLANDKVLSASTEDSKTEKVIVDSPLMQPTAEALLS